MTTTTRPGGRTARVRTAVLEATTALLAELGYAELTHERVAARAGVHKTTIYRRWPTKEALVMDTIRERSRVAVPVPDTGTLAGDLTALARSVAANVGSAEGTRIARTLVAASATSTEVWDDAREFWDERFAMCAPIIERAIARGELDPSTDPRLLIEMLIGPLYVRVLLTGEPVTKKLGEAVATFLALRTSASVSVP
jgi:AcrR family transcriptional regulator